MQIKSRQKKKFSNLLPTKNCLLKSTHNTIETFIDLTFKKIQTEKANCNNATLKQNLTLGERKALHELSKHSSVITSNIDKGRTVVIQDVKDYIKGVERQFGNKEYYKILDSDSIET